MTDKHAIEVWEAILKILDEKLQYGFLEQAKAVVDIHVDGGELKLTVATDEAEEFFNSEVNQQRLMITSRPVIAIEVIIVEKTDAEPLER